MNGRVLLALTLLAGASSVAAAQATQTVTFQVDAINQIAFVGSPSLTISTATAGSNPTNATANATWAITTNQSTVKITASIASNMPTGLTLSVALTAPSVGSSAGAQPLSTASVDLVTGIAQVAQTAIPLTYTLSALPSAGVVASQTRIVTYTITGGT